MAQRVKRMSTMRETWVQSLGREDPLEKEMATHFSTLAWRIPWMEEPGGLQSMESQSRTQLSDFTHSLTHSNVDSIGHPRGHDLGVIGYVDVQLRGGIWTKVLLMLKLLRRDGISLVVQWLRFHCTGRGSVPGWGTESPHAFKVVSDSLRPHGL